MVILTLKNLLQQTFTVDIELSCTVRTLKEKIEKENGSEYPAEGQKLIYAGKILQDDLSLESYNIDSKKFLVIMVTKPKAPPPSSAPADPTAMAREESPAATEESNSSTSTTTATTTTTTTSAVSEASTSSTTTTSSSSTSTTSSSSSLTTTTPAATVSTQPAESAESLIVMGDEFNKMVENIMEMGYERTEVERALRASFNNPYTAVQYLVDGIPPNIDFASQSSSTGGGGQATEESEGTAGGGDEENALSFLRAQPQFNQMRQMIRSNPQLLDAFIHQIGETNPDLLQVIQQNQEAFVRMLNEGAPSEGTGRSTGSAATTGGSGNLTGSSPSRGAPRGGPGQETIVVSHQDRDAIERLKALGNFPEDVVIQAYFACEKNENLAAEFLFSQTWD